jgi:signal transduction histidine kinase
VLLDAAMEVLLADEASMWRWTAAHQFVGMTRDRLGRLTPSDSAPDATVGQTATSVGRTVAEGSLAVPMVHEGELFGVLSVRAPGRTCSEADAATLEILAATGTAALAARQRVRMDGVLLAARTAQHELSNRLAVTAGYASLLAQHEDVPEGVRKLARQAERGANDAAELLRRLSHVTEIEELDWGDMGSTIDLQAPRPAVPRKSSMPHGRAAS